MKAASPIKQQPPSPYKKECECSKIIVLERYFWTFRYLRQSCLGKMGTRKMKQFILSCKTKFGIENYFTLFFIRSKIFKNNVFFGLKELYEENVPCIFFFEIPLFYPIKVRKKSFNKLILLQCPNCFPPNDTAAFRVGGWLLVMLTVNFLPLSAFNTTPRIGKRCTQTPPEHT